MPQPPTSPSPEPKSYGEGAEEISAEIWLSRVGADSTLAEDAVAAARPHCARPGPSIAWLMVIGLALWQLERYEEATQWLDRADPRRVQDPGFFALQGMVVRRLPGGEGRALEAYQRALELDPERGDVLFNIGNLLKETQPEQAIPYYEKSLALNGNAAGAWHNYGLALNEAGQCLKAAQALKTSLRLGPSDADAWCNLGLAFFGLERFERAKHCFRHAIALDGSHATSHVNFGQVLVETLEPEKALEHLRLGLALDSSSSNSLWNLSLALLLLGHYREGWRYYEARFATKQFEKQLEPTPQPLPRELGALPTAGEPELIVWSEQGLGDGIQFCRYLGMLDARGVPYRFLAHKPLLPLYRDWLGLGDRVVVALDRRQDGPRDQDQRFHIPLLSLPLLFGTELDTVPSITPYFTAPGLPPERLRVPEPPGGLAVGIVWATNPDNKAMYRNKTMPLACLMPRLLDLIDLDLIELHSLQVGADAEQLAPWRQHERITDWNGRLNDFSDTAHVVNQLDLVIAVDTAVAHLAAALHKPTWLLLPHNADFRWLHQRSDSPWYPTMRLFRQPTRGNWAEVVSQVEAAFDDLFILDITSLAAAKLAR
jgi:tetratricopeptide (TPR) repeat protein